MVPLLQAVALLRLESGATRREAVCVDGQLADQAKTLVQGARPLLARPSRFLVRCAEPELKWASFH